MDRRFLLPVLVLGASAGAGVGSAFAWDVLVQALVRALVRALVLVFSGGVLVQVARDDIMAGTISSHIVSDKLMYVLPCGNSFPLWHLIHTLSGVYAIFIFLLSNMSGKTPERHRRRPAAG